MAGTELRYRAVLYGECVWPMHYASYGLCIMHRMVPGVLRDSVCCYQGTERRRMLLPGCLLYTSPSPRDRG
eukprot:3330029-Rhodomonas_salina.2